MNDYIYVDDDLMATNTPDDAVRILSKTRNSLEKYDICQHLSRSYHIRIIDSINPSVKMLNRIASKYRQMYLKSHSLKEVYSLLPTAYTILLDG